MSSTLPAPVGRTRWRRFGVAAGAGFGLVAVLLYLLSSGALALNFAFSGIPFTLHADSLTGQHFVQYAVPDQLAQNTSPFLQGAAGQLINGGGAIDNVRQADNGNWYAADSVTQFRDATITGLEQTVCAPVTIIPGLGAIRVHLLGNGNTDASSLTIQAPALTANAATFNELNIGTTVKQGINNQQPGSDPYNAQNGPVGNAFAQDANTAELTNINQVGVGTEAGTFTVRGLQLWAEFTGGC